MRFFVIFIILSLFSIHASNIEKDYFINLKAENGLNIISLLETSLNIPDEFTLNDIIVITSQNVILETIDSSDKPNNFDELVENWIDILNGLAVNGTGSLLIKELKPYISKNNKIQFPVENF
jgi:hypothetical protein